MCGIVGLFVGCSAMAFCPRAQLAADGPDPEAEVDADDPQSDYQSPLRSWHEGAAVRSRPRRTIQSTESDRYYFSPDLVPLARHPIIRDLRPDLFREVLIQHLYRYLDFTAKLESLVVNRTVLGIAHDRVGVAVPEEMRYDAYKIYCDEAYHTLFSMDLARQVRQETAVRPRLPREPYFIQRLRKVQEAQPGSERALVELLFVIVSETLISATLASIPDDGSVVSAVRETTRDHALDEGRHHAYFAIFLRYLWGQLDDARRRRAACLVPALIDAFLRPDTPAARAELAGYGISRNDAEKVVAEVYAEDVVRAHTATAARHVLRYFADLGVLDDAEAAEEFERYGLLNGVS